MLKHDDAKDQLKNKGAIDLPWYQCYTQSTRGRG